MKTFSYMTHRKAIAMIELIFAIVIMGLAVMSAPMLISQAKTGGLAVTQQEAIAACASEVSMIMTRAWDEADTSMDNTNPILQVDENIPALNRQQNTGRRVGIPQHSSRTFIRSDGRGDLRASEEIGNDGNDNGVFDDVDDWDNHATNLTLKTQTDTETGDYIDESLRMATAVGYIVSPANYNQVPIRFDNPFNQANQTTNIKFISTTITSANHDDVLATNIRLRAFVCNVGSYTLIPRAF